MTHLPYIAAAYGLTASLAIWLAVGAGMRLAKARRRLEAAEALRGRRTPRA